MKALKTVLAEFSRIVWSFSILGNILQYLMKLNEIYKILRQLLLSMFSKVFCKISVLFVLVQNLKSLDLAMAKNEQVNITVTLKPTEEFTAVKMFILQAPVRLKEENAGQVRQSDQYLLDLFSCQRHITFFSVADGRNKISQSVCYCKFLQTVLIFRVRHRRVIHSWP